MKKILFFILMAASLFMYSCESNDDSSPDNNPVDTEFSTDRSIHIKAFSSENARTFSTTYKETGCSECNADGTEFDAILFDKNSSNKTYRYILNIKVSPQKDIKKGDKLTMVGGFFAGSIKENRNFKGITQEETKELIDTLYAFSVLSYEAYTKKNTQYGEF